MIDQRSFVCTIWILIVAICLYLAVAKDETIFSACKWKEVMGILLVDISVSSMMALQSQDHYVGSS
jgi:hypothetical protein